MDARTKFALGIGGLAAVAAILFGLFKQVGVKSYGMPTGRVVRAGPHLAVVMETRDPYLPSLKGVPESRMSYSYNLWLIPEAGGPPQTIRLDRAVRSGDRTHVVGARAYDSGVVWLAIKELQGVEVTSGRVISSPPPPSIANMPISKLLPSNANPLEAYRVQSVTLPSGDRLALLSDQELKTDYAPNARLYDTPTAPGGFRPCTLHRVTVQPGPIPRVATSSPVNPTVLRNAAFIRKSENGGLVTFTNPDGFLIVHEAGDPLKATIRLSRLNVDGSLAWSADTGIGTLSQYLPHDRLPAFVGQLPGHLTEPTLTIVNLETGAATTTSLKGPLN